jgi:flagellar biosynthesis anti-sigma factor FlgM
MDGIDKLGGAGDLARRMAGSAAATTTAPVTAATPVAEAKGAGQQATPETANLLSILADAAPPVDSKKVQAIQSLIASGAYPIDSHAIAAKMLALDFPGAGGDADA